MSFVRKRKIYDLDLTGTDLEGLTLQMYGMTIEESMTLSALREVENLPTDQQIAKLPELFQFVAGKIHMWDLETADGTPVKPSAEELMSWDVSDAYAVIGRWQEKVESVPAPLERRSSGGTRLEVPPIPQDIPLPNLPPSSMPN